MTRISILLKSVNRLARPALGTVFIRFAVIGLSLISSVLTARFLGPDGRGQYFQVLTMAGLVAQFSNFGLTSSNTFYVAQNRDRSWPILVNSILLSSCVFLFTVVLIFFFGPLLTAYFGTPVNLLWFIPMLSGAILLFNLTCSVMAGNEKFFALNVWQFGNAILVVVGMLTLGLIVPTPTIFLLVTSVAACISALAGVIILKPSNSYFHPNFSLFKKSIGFSSRAYLVLLIGFLLPRIGILIIGGSHGAYELGQYSIAVQIFDVMAILPTSLALVLFPRLIKSGDDRWTVTKVSLWITMTMIFLMSLIIGIFGERLIEGVFGKAYGPSFPAVISFLPGIIAYAAISILSQYVVSSGFPYKLVVIWCSGLLITFILALSWVPKWGASGAALAQSGGLVVILIGVISIIYSKHKERPL